MDRILVALNAAALVLIVGCSSGKPPTQPKPFDVEASLIRAWGYFSSGEYDDGAELFSKVLEHSPNNPEAYLGKGWCTAFTGGLDSAFNNLWASINNDTFGDYTTDANMGLAAVLRDCTSYPDYLSRAIERASAVISDDPEYEFSRRPSVNYKDAHLIIAQCYFRRGVDYFWAARVAVNELCSFEGIEPLPEQGSLPADEFEHLLGEKIEVLTELIGD
jgi:hypothetical protein